MIAATLWPTSPGRPAPRCLKVGLATRQPARFARQAPRLSAVGRCVAGARHRARSSTRQRDRANCHRFRTAVDPARQWPHQASRSWLSDLQLRGQAALRNVCPPGLNEACAPRRRDGAEPWQSPAGRHHAVVADALQAPTVATVLVALQKPALSTREESTRSCVRALRPQKRAACSTVRESPGISTYSARMRSTTATVSPLAGLTVWPVDRLLSGDIRP